MFRVPNEEFSFESESGRIAVTGSIFFHRQSEEINCCSTKEVAIEVRNKKRESKNWVHELEIDVTNTSDKPIYYLDFVLLIPGVKNLVTSEPVGFWLEYGRVQLISFGEPLLPDDVPIRAGENHTFRIPAASANGWEEVKKRDGHPTPRFLELQFQRLNFGDGTGFNTTAAEPVNIHPKARSQISPPSNGVLDFSDFLLPARSLPAPPTTNSLVFWNFYHLHAKFRGRSVET
jgi:hypothetical protein